MKAHLYTILSIGAIFAGTSVFMYLGALYPGFVAGFLTVTLVSAIVALLYIVLLDFFKNR